MKKDYWQMIRTRKGAARMLGIFLILVLLFTCVAALLAHSGTRVVITEITTDVRGATLNGELYTPRGVKTGDNLPAVIVAHGGSCTYGVVSGISQELARRGFVVFNVSAYGSGKSENPITDDSGSAPGNFASARGIYDAMVFVQSLEYVDASRIGLTGHSMGGVRTSAAGAMDGSWYTLNDLLINVLYEHFDIQFTEEEIYEDADELAAKYLNDDQMAYYEYLKAETEEYYRLRPAAVLTLGIGSNASTVQTRTVNVGGYEVERLLNVNSGVLTGKYDELVAGRSYSIDTTKYRNAEGAALDIGTNYFMLNGPAEVGMVYRVDPTKQDPAATVGMLTDLSVLNDPALKETIDNRQLRFFYLSNETHSQNFLSNETTGIVCRFFEQTLGYNNGNLGDPAAAPIDYDNIIWLWREIFNFLAMCFMWAALIPLAGLLLTSRSFEGLAAEPAEPRIDKKNKSFWIISAVLAITSLVAVLYMGGWGDSIKSHTLVKGSWFFPYDGTPAKIFGWMIIVGIVSALAIVINCLVNKEAKFADYVSDYGINIGWKKWLKTLLLSFAMFALTYVLTGFLYMTMNMDFRLWMVGFHVVDARQLFAILRYFIPLTVLFAISGVLINSGRMKDMSEAKNVTLNLFFAFIGLFVLAVIIYTIAVVKNVNAPSSFFLSCFGLVLMVVVNGYLNRKLYLVSGSIWLGAFVNAWLVAWLWCSLCDSSFLYRF